MVRRGEQRQTVSDTMGSPFRAMIGSTVRASPPRRAVRQGRAIQTVAQRSYVERTTKSIRRQLGASRCVTHSTSSSGR